ncbi:hypothetical protein HKCCE2091_04935 [Rhodobacterales bacterium HKCCE2091]|nr:hypothetical protein [Rhodobacterales bacterium HKCCE2091]
MVRSSFVTVIALALSSVLGAVGAAGAVTVSELDHGEFSGNWAAPTVLGAGVDGVSGTGAGNQYDIFHLTGLAPGAQVLSFRFDAPAGIGYSYSAGGMVTYATQAFRWGWDGQTAGSFATSYWSPSVGFDLALGAGFSGDLYLGLWFTYGANLSYSVSSNVAAPVAPVLSPAPGPVAADPISPVPLPAPVLMLGAALAAGAFVGRRRRT